MRILSLYASLVSAVPLPLVVLFVLSLAVFGLIATFSRRLTRRPARTIAVPVLLLALCFTATGCDDFETGTYKVLAFDQQLILGARQAYIDRTIPRTADVKKTIEDAGDAHNVAVQGLLAYHNVSAAKGSDAQAAAAKQSLQDALVPLAKLIGDITALGVKPAATTAAPAAVPSTAKPLPVVMPLYGSRYHFSRAWTLPSPDPVLVPAVART